MLFPHVRMLLLNKLSCVKNPCTKLQVCFYAGWTLMPIHVKSCGPGLQIYEPDKNSFLRRAALGGIPTCSVLFIRSHCE